MRYILIVIGVLFTLLGFLGAVLPLLPTTPFLLVAVICFAKSSKRFHDRLIRTTIYRAYVEDFRKYRGLYHAQKDSTSYQFIHRDWFFNSDGRCLIDSHRACHHGYIADDCLIYVGTHTP